MGLLHSAMGRGESPQINGFSNFPILASICQMKDTHYNFKSTNGPGDQKGVNYPKITSQFLALSVLKSILHSF